MDKLVDFMFNISGTNAYLLLFGTLLACGFGLPVPEDIVLFGAGYYAHLFPEESNVFVMVLISLVGVLLGDSAIFYLGHKHGRKLVNRFWLFRKLLPPERLDMVQKKLHNQGNKVIFAARFMPGLRMPIFFSAGTLHLPFRIFFFYDGLASLISVPAIVYSVYYFGDEVDHIIKVIRRVEHGIIFVIISVALILTLKWYLNSRSQRVVKP
ncbi:MAG: DedA family protein [Bacteriovoracia bacterium]